MTDIFNSGPDLKKALAYWGAGFTVVAGFLYYHSVIPLGPILIAGLVTLVITYLKYRKPK